MGCAGKVKVVQRCTFALAFSHAAHRIPTRRPARRVTKSSRRRPTPARSDSATPGSPPPCRRCCPASSPTGMDAVLHYARELDRWDSPTAGAGRPHHRHQRRPAARERPRGTRTRLRTDQGRSPRPSVTTSADFEIELAPGVVAGQRYVPVPRVGAYLPAGRFPLTASAFMTVGVAKIAGVPTVLACTPPQPDGKRSGRRPVLDLPLRGRSRLRPRRRPGTGRDGVRPARRAAHRHAGRSRQRLRRRGETPALRQGLDRPAGRPVGGRGHRRRDRRPGDRRRRPARPGRARTGVPRRPGHHVAGVGPRGDRRGRPPARDAVHPGHRRAGLAQLRFGHLGGRHRHRRRS